MGVSFEIKRKITVNGQEYESLDQIPEEFRTAVQKALAAGAVPKTTIHINGKTYASMEEMPAALRAIATGLTSLVMKAEAQPMRPEPVLSLKMIVLAIGLAALLFWLARLAL